ncbi:hypothetical protein [Streptomyces sp. NBC_01294]|uniref:hypothetical protein n=1 Tax=Streptomyces sp. NBC_01294 TaxID=2903815 RepID=UPI002DD81A4F|nr:hypothetical protein [Streptomyces sp. NBC_01294]WRZ57360.1 hypothetical protein OG534_13225 [Streptomyces sp. NBC_01294]
METFTKPGATIAGLATEARAEAVYEQKTAGGSDFNKGLQDGTKWTERAFGLVTKPLEASVVGAPVAWVIEDAKESVTKHYERDSAATAEEKAKSLLDQRREATARAAAEAAVAGAKQAGLSEEEQKKFGDDAYHSVTGGYERGRSTHSGYQPPPSKGGAK